MDSCTMSLPPSHCQLRRMVGVACASEQQVASSGQVNKENCAGADDAMFNPVTFLRQKKVTGLNMVHSQRKKLP